MNKDIIASLLPSAVKKKLAVVGNHNTVAFEVRLFLDILLEVYGAHDAIAEHFVNDFC